MDAGMAWSELNVVSIEEDGDAGEEKDESCGGCCDFSLFELRRSTQRRRPQAIKSTNKR